MFGDRRTKDAIEVPRTSEKLRQWCLPMTADAIAADEKRFEEKRREANSANFLDALEALAKQMGGKVTVQNG